MLLIWSGFILLVLLMLVLDLGVFNRKDHAISTKEALGWSAVWIAISLLFGVFIYFGYEYQWLGLGVAADAVDGTINDGSAAFVKYLTGYIVEKSLSVDNIFVMALIFGFMGVARRYQHRVLIWGIIGALILRGAMIGIGAQLIARFQWILYVFGGFLVLTALKMLLVRDGHNDPSKSVAVRLIRRFSRVTDRYHCQHFVVRAGSEGSHAGRVPEEAPEPDPTVDRARPGTWLLTPLALALVLIETTDLIFAVDSIPAVFAITADPFLVFTSNIFAILGLRSLYFALAGMVRKFRYLKVALAAVLAIVGFKMLAHTWLQALLGRYFNLYLLAAIAVILAAGVIASIVADRRDREKELCLKRSGG
ncbi:MAG: TerC/Alx family metal homeostasis membrane protein [Tepidisphaeraceae bacterium]|jgi:tellurite resistance protein TerC